ncbi:conserved Plasmodium protein, unknown function [Plasmodium berghei]|uniref:Uncharacterized protein n=2 Tax=Plasmodium berghei TaxID=5821 RepID=A0A509AJ51_PLABA|nr:conserved Plasmodium protein, unknown function [Plasmodium berghei ANKA]CXH80869.1 conserved Plasmodium protein, unknown function [Plasmodium berghei]SCM19075.1 conserved Plasmodium protein, unknown function [Plasmodium berghei]SCN21583.1 conserved Plasmodium protein, unknown function [Plasmodium berghei]SCO58818.1 conserved Plasmodium protein, unknown function [Plasmodium berghei]SCO58867.1 conserved Plasmodium protein, unknown function [Plasmodium berghei]|eukprot:XP_034419647.1 conserved Plasmodium protein, unknown function [Plasmodium berghei ANKA]
MEINENDVEIKNSDVIWESLYNDFEEITDTNKKHFNYIENSLYNFCKGVHSSEKANCNLKNRNNDIYGNNNCNKKNNEDNKLEQVQGYNITNSEENNNQLSIINNNDADYDNLKKKYISYGKIYKNENDYLKNNYVDNDSDYLKADTHISYNDFINSDKTRNSENLNVSFSNLSSELKKKTRAINNDVNNVNDVDNGRKNHNTNGNVKNVVSFMSEFENTKQNIDINKMRKNFLIKRKEDYTYLLSNKKIYDDSKSCRSEMLYSSRFSTFDNYKKKNSVPNKLKNNKNFDINTEFNFNYNNSAFSEINTSHIDIRNIEKNMNINITNLNSLERLDMLLKKKNNNLANNFNNGNPELSFFLNHEKNNNISRKALSQCANNDYKMYSYMLEKFDKIKNPQLTSTIEETDHNELINRSKKLLEISKKCLSENKNGEKKYNTNTFRDINSNNFNKKSQNFILSKLIRNCHSTDVPSVGAISTFNEKINPNNIIKNGEYEISDCKNEVSLVKQGSIHGGKHTYEHSGKNYINLKKGKDIIPSPSPIDVLSQIDDKEKEKCEKEYNKCLHHLFEAYDKEKIDDINMAENNILHRGNSSIMDADSYNLNKNINQDEIHNDKNENNKINITDCNESYISNLKGNSKTNVGISNNASDFENFDDKKSYLGLNFLFNDDTKGSKISDSIDKNKINGLKLFQKNKQNINNIKWEDKPSILNESKEDEATNDIENIYDLKNYEFNLDYQNFEENLKQSCEKKISDEIKMLKNKLINERIGINDDNNSISSKKNISNGNSIINLYENNKDNEAYTEKLKKEIIEYRDLEHIPDEYFNKNYNGNDLKLLFKENLFLQELCEKRKIRLQKYKIEKAKLCVEMKSLLTFNNNLSCTLKEKEAEITILKKEKEELESYLMKQLTNNTNNKYEFLKNFQLQHSINKQEKSAIFNTCSSNGYNMMLCDKNDAQLRYTNDNNSSVIKSYEDKIQELLIQIKMYQKKNSDLQEQLKIFMNE